MKINPKRICEAASTAAALETMYAIGRSHSFYVIPTVLYLSLEFIFFVVIFSLGSFIAAWISTKGSIRKGIFFTIAIVPSIISYLSFYTSGNISYYEQNGGVLIADHGMTEAGVLTFVLDIIVSVVIAFVATAIYFRASSSSKLS